MTPSRPSPPAPRLLALAAAALLVAAVAGVYWPSLEAPFVFDDLTSIQENPSIRRLWPLSIPLSPPGGTGTTVDGRPVLNLSFAFNHAIGGLDTRGYHALNVAIHLCCGLLLFGIIRRTLSFAAPTPPAIPDRIRTLATPLAFIATVLWLLHPLATAAVSHTSRRADTLVALFLLATLYAFIRAQRSAAEGKPAPAPESTDAVTDRIVFRRGWLIASVIACALGMATKETMAVAPLIALLYDRTFIAGDFATALRKRRGFHASLAATWGILALLILDSGNRGGTAGLGTEVSSWHYALTQGEAIARYAQLAFWPAPLVFDYGTSLETSFARALPSMLFVGALIAATLVALRRRSAIGFLGACFFLLLAPSSSVIPVATQTIAEHRMYLPLAALVVAATSLAVFWLRKPGLVVAAALALPLAWLTAARNGDYRDELTLWTDTVAKRPENARARDFLGRALIRAGRRAEAIPAFEKAVALQPANSGARSNLGSALLEEGRIEEAVAHLGEAARLDPDSFAAQANLGNALLRAGRPRDALAPLAAAARLEPAVADAQFRLGLAYSQSGDATQAIRQHERALALDPRHVDARYALAGLLARTHRLPEAAAQFEEVIRQDPTHLEALNNLGNVCLLLRRPREAIPHYQAALALKPTATTHANLGAAHLLTGSIAEAIAEYRAALSLDPDYAPAQTGLEQALARSRP